MSRTAWAMPWLTGSRAEGLWIVREGAPNNGAALGTRLPQVYVCRLAAVRRRRHVGRSVEVNQLADAPASGVAESELAGHGQVDELSDTRADGALLLVLGVT